MKKYSPYALPEYLVRSYWWAYLSPLGAKFFDQDFIVNRILWGNYQVIAKETIDIIASKPEQKVAGISCAYGHFFPDLVNSPQIAQLYLFDIAPIQINLMRKKIKPEKINDKCQFFLSDAQNIALISKSVDTSVLFFLLHELPSEVRTRVLKQAIRITKNKGRLIIVDYAPYKQQHVFHKNRLFRNIFQKMEPYLANFWRCDLLAEINEQAELQQRTIKLTDEKKYYNDFYRLLEFNVE